MSGDEGTADAFTATAAVQQPFFTRLSVVEYRSVDRKLGAVLILLANVFERAAFFSLTSNLIYFLTRAPLCWSDDAAATLGLVFSGSAYMLCLPAGFLADFGWAKFPAAIVGYVTYAAGYAALPALGLSAWSQDDGGYAPEGNTSAVAARCRHDSAGGPTSSVGSNVSLPPVCHFGRGDRERPCEAALYITLAVIAVGAALLHTNLPTFGADQVSQQGLALTRCFISFFGWTRNVGAFIANAGIAQLQNSHHGFFASGLASFCLLLLSAVTFAAGYSRYRRIAASRLAVRNFFAIPLEAQRVKKRAGTRSTTALLGPTGGVPVSCLDFAKVYFGGRYSEKAVEDVKGSGRMLLVFALLAFYWMGFSQLTNSFQIQGLHMRLPGTGSTSIPPALLLLFDNVSILVMLPLLDNVIYPFVGRRGYRLTLHIRFAVGMVLGSLSFAVAACVEYFRLQSLKEGTVAQIIGHTIYEAAPLSVFVQVPQYVLLGISQAFTIITAMEYAYVLAPTAMKSIMMGALYVVAGVGVFASAVLPYVQREAFGWTSINDSRMDLMFLALAAVQLVSAVAFYLVGRRFNLGLDKLTIETARRRQSPFLPQEPLADPPLTAATAAAGEIDCLSGKTDTPGG